MSLQNAANFQLSANAELANHGPHYIASNQKYISVPDSSQFSYGTGYVNIQGSSIASASLDKCLDLKESYLQVPWLATLKCSASGKKVSWGNRVSTTVNGTTTYTNRHAPENVYALVSKGAAHLVDTLQVRFGSKTIINNSTMRSFPHAEQTKTWNSCGEAERLGEMTGHYVDSSSSYSLGGTSPNFIELNNASIPASSFVDGAATQQANEAMVKRMRLNQDWISPTSPDRFNHIFNQAAGNDAGCTGLIGICDSAGNALDPTVASADGTEIAYLVFQFVTIMPTHLICSFFKELPQVLALRDLYMTPGFNICNQNVWSVTYSAAAGTDKLLVPTSVAVTQSMGSSCPFMLAPISYPAVNGGNVVGSGARLWCEDSATVPTVTCRACLGYYGDRVNSIQLNSLTGLPLTPSTSMPISLNIKQVVYTPSLRSELIKDAFVPVHFKEWLVDGSFTGLVPGTRVSRMLQVEAARYRRLFAFVFFSPNTASCSPYQSLLSSAPNTCSKAKLTHWQIQLGQANIFESEVNTDLQQFYQLRYPLEGQDNGNGFSSMFLSGQTSFRDLRSGIVPYVFDLQQGVFDEESDNMVRKINVAFTIQGNSALRYDVVFFVEYENQCSVHPITGDVR